MKKLIKRLMAATPYRIMRDNGPNRFNGMEACLRSMKNRDFQPTVVIDGGAHVGTFSLLAKSIFPKADYHLIEPQPVCHTPLRALCMKEGWTLHACAISDHVGSSRLRVTQDFDTGAYLTADADAHEIKTETLDHIFSDTLKAERVLLKLDLQGHELRALQGAAGILPHIDVILTEASFYIQLAEPTIAELIGFLNDNQFQLYDIAALGARERDNRPHQADLVFARTGSLLVADTGWS